MKFNYNTILMIWTQTIAGLPKSSELSAVPKHENVICISQQKYFMYVFRNVFKKHNVSYVPIYRV